MSGVFKKIGNWTGLDKLMNNLSDDIRQANKQSLRRTGLHIERLAVMHLKNQDLEWQSLTEKYLKRKAKKGLSNKILIATSDYMQSITSFATENEVFAGVRKNVSNSEGDDLVSIAAVHEFGNDNMPERPLWRPVHKETIEWLRKTKMFSEEVYKEWAKNL